MNFDDKQFEQLVKKSRRKRLINTLLGSTFSIIFLAVILLGGYLFYWNLGPFQGEKVAGVPDGQIRSFTENENGHLASLLLDYYGSYGFNVKGKKLLFMRTIMRKTNEFHMRRSLESKMKRLA